VLRTEITEFFRFSGADVRHAVQAIKFCEAPVRRFCFLQNWWQKWQNPSAPARLDRTEARTRETLAGIALEWFSVDAERVGAFRFGQTSALNLGAPDPILSDP